MILDPLHKEMKELRMVCETALRLIAKIQEDQEHLISILNKLDK